MSKIICDVCGTAYPDNADQCPICGCAKPAAAESGGSNGINQNGYNYIKGGRFSKSNVRKRTGGSSVTRAPSKKEKPIAADRMESEEDPKENNRGLVVAVVVLLIAIVSVAIYIFIRFFAPFTGKPGDTTLPSNTTTAPAVTTAESTAPRISCTGLTVSLENVTLDKVGRSVVLEISAEPEDTTDPITFLSSDASIAAVMSDGRIVAAGPGEAVITITCGDVVKTCKVLCDFSGMSATVPPATNTQTEPSTAPTTAPTTVPPTTEAPSPIALNRKDFTLFSAGSSWKLYVGSVDVDDITFSSDDEAVATFVDGKVVAVGPGTTKVHASYDGEKVSCIVRCKFAATQTQPSTSTESTTTPPETEEQQETLYIAINSMVQTATSVTYQVGENFLISLVNAAGDPVETQFQSSDSTCCKVEGNNTVKTLMENKTATISTTYKEVTYSIVVRVEGGASG